MLSIWQWILIAILSFIALLVAAGLTFEAAAERRDDRENRPEGQLFSVAGRHVHLLCKGSSEPTIVIEQGAGEPAHLWWAIQDRVAQFARVCTYDRAGYGWSDSAAPDRTIDQRVEDLHLLLSSAKVPGPFVLVAHSYGGLIIRRYAELHPDLVAGLVLVDTPEEEGLFRPEVLSFYSRMRGMLQVVRFSARLGILRLLSVRHPIDKFGLPFIRPQEYAAAIDDLASLEKVASAMRRSKPSGMFKDLPLAVITHGVPFPGPFAVLEQGWHDGQVHLASLSSESELTIATNSNHMIQHDEPDVVVNAIRRIHTLASTKSSNR